MNTKIFSFMFYLLIFNAMLIFNLSSITNASNNVYKNISHSSKQLKKREKFNQKQLCDKKAAKNCDSVEFSSSSSDLTIQQKVFLIQYCIIVGVMCPNTDNEIAEDLNQKNAILSKNGSSRNGTQISDQLYNDDPFLQEQTSNALSPTPILQKNSHLNEVEDLEKNFHSLEVDKNEINIEKDEDF